MELNKVKVTATISGKECFIISMRLEQGFNCHHKFDIIIDYEEFDSNWLESPEAVFGLLGENVNIEMQHEQGEGLSFFLGLITQASYIGHHGGKNHIRISGCSPTILLDGSKTMNSFEEMNLDSIISEAVEVSGNAGKVERQPQFSGEIDYVCQYDETCFEFLNRLSYLYGEWFFYDGLDCYFGKKDGGEEEVTFESDMLTFDLSANLLPSKMKRYHYLVHDDNKTDNEPPDPSTSGYHSVAQGKSSSAYTSKAVLPVQAVVLSDGELEVVAKAERNRSTFSMLTINGTSQTSKVKIGGKIKVKLPKKNTETPGKSVDTFLVTSVVHEFDLKGQYRNTFKAIPSTVENIPMQPVQLPVALSQIAVVKRNDDDKQRGRVKVAFQWQEDKGKTTNWIRVSAPDAGKSDIVPKNRGWVTIPEKNDIVMVGFEYGDPNRPFVAGSIFSEKVSAGGQKDNKIKSFTTRVDSSITFDDEKGSITIKDKKGSDSKMVFDGKTNITITAATSLTINIGNGASTLKMDNKGNIELNGSTIRLNASDAILLNSKNYLEMEGKKNAKFLSGQILIQADQKDVTIDGTGGVIKLAKGQVDIN